MSEELVSEEIEFNSNGQKGQEKSKKKGGGNKKKTEGSIVKDGSVANRHVKLGGLALAGVLENDDWLLPKETELEDELLSDCPYPSWSLYLSGGSRSELKV